MDGLVIVITTVIILFAAVYFLVYIQVFFTWILHQFKYSGILGKILIIVPLIIVGILSTISSLILLIGAIVTVIYAANSIRNWWHKGN